VQNNQAIIHERMALLKHCTECGNDIGELRLECMPDTDTCVKCSKATGYVGFMDWSHKTAPELVLINSADKENIRRATAINERRR
jgi:hypothetical protein